MGERLAALATTKASAAEIEAAKNAFRQRKDALKLTEQAIRGAYELQR